MAYAIAIKNIVLILTIYLFFVTGLFLWIRVDNEVPELVSSWTLMRNNLIGYLLYTT